MSDSGAERYTVAVRGDVRVAALVDAVLSSLPRTYSRSVPTLEAEAEADANTAADVVAIGGSADWADAAAQAIEGGATGIIVVEPSIVAAERITRVIEIAHQHRASVRLARRWASDPAVPAFSATRLPDMATTLIDSRVELPADAHLPSAFVAQIDLLQTAVSGAVEIESVVFNDGSYAATGRLIRGERRDLLLLSAASSSQFRHRASVRELLFEGRRSLEVGDGETARAAVASVGDAAGTRILPPVYETGYRAAWRELAADLASDPAADAAAGSSTAPPDPVTATPDLEDYRSAVVAAETVLKEAAR